MGGGVEIEVHAQRQALQRLKARSGRGPDGVMHEEVHESLGHFMWILHLQPVRCARKDEPLDMRQPFQKHLVRFPKTGPESVAAAEDYENRLSDASRLRLAETPVQLSWQFHFEPGCCVVDCLREGSGQHPVNDTPLQSAPAGIHLRSVLQAPY